LVNEALTGDTGTAEILAWMLEKFHGKSSPESFHILPYDFSSKRPGGIVYDKGGTDGNPTRDQIRETVQANGGRMSAAEIARIHEMPRKRAAYYLLVLEQEHVAPDYLAGSATPIQ
jgi:hypothetical protein